MTNILTFVLFIFFSALGGYFDYKGVEGIANGTKSIIPFNLNLQTVLSGLLSFTLGIAFFVIAVGFLNQLANVKPAIQTIIWMASVIMASAVLSSGGFSSISLLHKILFIVIGLSVILMVYTSS